MYERPVSSPLSKSPSELPRTRLRAICIHSHLPRNLTTSTTCNMQILPPEDEDAPEMRRLLVPRFDDEQRREPVQEPPVEDVIAEMALVQY